VLYQVSKPTTADTHKRHKSTHNATRLENAVQSSRQSRLSATLLARQLGSSRFGTTAIAISIVGDCLLGGELVAEIHCLLEGELFTEL
jgi:hypothetical protein